MRTRTKITLLTLAPLGVLSACGDDSAKQHSTTELSAALLTVDDLGGSWTEDHSYSFDQRTAENPPVDSSAFCPAASTETASLTDLAGPSGAEVELKMGDSRTVRIQLWDNGDAEAYFNVVDSAVKTCDATEWTDDTVGSTNSFTAIEGPSVGDDSVNWLGITTPPTDNPHGKYGGTSHTTVARFGSVIMTMHVHDIAVSSDSTTITDEEWRSLVSKAAEKVADL